MKKSIRFYPALWSAKLLGFGLKLAHRKGSHNPGALAMKICPDFLKQIEKPEVILGVTGTNGKTTVCNMVNDILEDNGYHPASNRAGSNILGGVVTTLVHAVDWKGRCTKDLAVLELDERSSRLIYPYVKPKYILVTNLFRDSFKRNAHSGFIFDILHEHLPEESTLILNADDPVSFRLRPAGKAVYFGVDPQPEEPMNEPNIIQDMPNCPECGAPLVYEFRRYHHVGRVHCPRCSFASPKADYLYEGDDGQTARISSPSGTLHLKKVGPALTDLYNMAGVAALLSAFGLTKDELEASFRKVKVLGSRYREETIGGKTVVSAVAKGQNSVACSRVFDTIRQQPGRKAVILMLDDLGDSKETSENMAWLYDTDFEFLNDPSVTQIVAIGKRREDYRVRLLLAGIPAEKIGTAETEAEGVNLLRTESYDRVYLLYDVYTVFHGEAAKKALSARLKEVR